MSLKSLVFVPLKIQPQLLRSFGEGLVRTFIASTEASLYLQITVELPAEIAKLPKTEFDEAVRGKGWSQVLPKGSLVMFRENSFPKT